ncbi:MAG: glycosyltransferase [Candidatus Nanopusillus sp.]|nr:glycosyltransferase [Candidatus Nanopusillus sp.]
MRISVLLDHRWNSGVKTYSISISLLFLKLYELLKLFFEDAEIDFYVMTFNGYNVEYSKVDFSKLYELYKNKNIKEIVNLAIKENYASKSQRITLDDILEGFSNSDFVFINNVGFGVFNRSLNKENLNKILSNDGKSTYMFMFHISYSDNFLANLMEFINSGELKNISEITKNRINSLVLKKIEKGYMDDNDQKELMSIIEYLLNSDTEEAREFRRKYSWWVEELNNLNGENDYIYTFKKIAELENSVYLFPTSIVGDANRRFIKNIHGLDIGEGKRKIKILFEPMYMITIKNLYGEEIKYYKNVLLERYKDKKINLLYIGRSAEEKGIHDAISLFEDLVKEGEDIRLIIVSPDFKKDSEEYKRLEEIVNKYGRGEVHIYSELLGNSLYVYPLHYIAFLEALGELKSTVVINPAYTESFGYATLESLIFGKLLVIYRDIEALKELKEKGYLNYQTAFKTYENLVSLAKRIIEEIKNGKYDEYVNKEKIEELEKEVDPEKLAYEYAKIIGEILYDRLKSEYNNSEAQSEEITAAAA